VRHPEQGQSDNQSLVQSIRKRYAIERKGTSVMKQLTNITPEQATAAYAQCMVRVNCGAYSERTPQQYEAGSYPPDGIEESLDTLITWAMHKGLAFRHIKDTQNYTLIPIPVQQVWRSGDTTWNVLATYFNGDQQMWHCRIVSPESPDGRVEECRTEDVRAMAIRIDE
jgi:hypothetical protein